jgi:branched-chain amino acid transport system permease protein
VSLDRHARIQAGVIVALLAFLVFALPSMLSAYWVDVTTSVVIYAVVALGLGLLMGRVGLVSLGQIAILGLGAWVAARLTYATSLPYPIVLLLAGAMTAVLGTLVGLPALRLSGLFLALITLMLAGAITVVLTTTQFPNGGPGFLGHTDSSLGSNAIRRPAVASSDTGYLRYTVLVAVLMFGVVVLHLRSKAGRAWAAIRQSEASALAAGVNITRYKLWALGLASFISGIAGGLLAGSVGKLYIVQFPISGNILLLAAVMMGGIYTLWGAVAAGMLIKLLPALLDDWGLSPDLLTILFGVGILQVLITAPEGIAVQLPRDLARLAGLLSRPFQRREAAREEVP